MHGYQTTSQINYRKKQSEKGRKRCSKLVVYLQWFAFDISSIFYIFIVYNIETYDITTVRASVGQYLISKWVRENTNIKVLLIGDGSDELTKGYKYNHKAPSIEVAQEDTKRLLRDIIYFDGQRADRGIASNGLEARLPFLDRRIISLYLSIEPKLTMPIDGIEKWLLRESFRDSNILPNEVLYRSKEAFSDGVSSIKKSWYQTVQE